MAWTTDDNEVREAANDILRECPFMITRGSVNQFSETGFDSQTDREGFERTLSAAGVTLKKWGDLSFEDKQKLMRALNRITHEEDEDAVLGIATLMKAIGYPGTVKLRAPSVLENDSTGAIDVEDFQEYINAQNWAYNYYCNGASGQQLTKEAITKLYVGIRTMKAPALRGILSKNGFGYEEFINTESADVFVFNNGDFKPYSQAAARQGAGSGVFRPSKINGMILASARGNAEIVKALIDHKGDVNKTDSLGRSPLWWAAVNGNEDVYDLLKSRKANFGQLSQENVTEFMNAFLDGEYKAHDVEVVKAMMTQARESGVKLTFDEQKIETLLKEPEGSVARQIGEEIRRYQESLNPAKHLLRAIELGDVQKVQSLLDRHGSALDLNALPVVGQNNQTSQVSALHYTLSKTQDPAKRKEVLEVLLKVNPQPKVTVVDLELAKRAAEGKPEDSVEKAILNRLTEVHKAQNPVPDKAQELRAAIQTGLAGNILSVLETADDETIKTVLAEKGMGAQYCKAFANRHAANTQLAGKYKELSELYQKLDNETDEAKRKEIQQKIAGTLQGLSSESELEPGEKKVITLLQSVYVSAPEPSRTPAPSREPGMVSPTQPVVKSTPAIVTPAPTQRMTPGQAGAIIGGVQPEEEHTPWYKQEWLWWVLGIALAATLGFFAFRKGGWLNKEKKTKTVASNENSNSNSNTNDNSNSNTGNSNTGTENSGNSGTLGSNSENISAAEVNDMIASGIQATITKTITTTTSER